MWKDGPERERDVSINTEKKKQKETGHKTPSHSIQRSLKN